MSATREYQTEEEYQASARKEKQVRAGRRAKEDEDDEDQVRKTQRQSKSVMRVAIKWFIIVTIIGLAVMAFAFIPINASHNFQFFEMIVGRIDGGDSWHLLYVALAYALVIVGGGLWLLLPEAKGAAKAWCLIGAVFFGIMSHLASHLSLDGQTVAAISKETADSDRAKIAMMGVEAMAAQAKAAAANSEAASGAVNNLTSQYGNWDAASVGEVNRNQLPSLTAAQSSAGIQMQQASRALERAMSAASESVAAGASSDINKTFQDLGNRFGWTPEETRVITNASFSGVISWGPLILTYVMGAIAFGGASRTVSTPANGNARREKGEADKTTEKKPRFAS